VSSPSLITSSGTGDEITCPISDNQISPKVVCFAVRNSIEFLSATDRKPFATTVIPSKVKFALLVFVKMQPKPGASAALPAWRVAVTDADPVSNRPRINTYQDFTPPASAQATP
jgi:hypothetical protein